MIISRLRDCLGYLKSDRLVVLSICISIFELDGFIKSEFVKLSKDTFPEFQPGVLYLDWKSDQVIIRQGQYQKSCC